MNYREKEFIDIEIEARWLDVEHARNAYRFACAFVANDRYGLNRETVMQIATHKIVSDSVATGWLSSNFPSDGTVQIVFGEKEVCVVQASDLLSQWFDIFTPGRDDAIVVHNISNNVMFYCHEQELEVGIRENV